MKDILLSFFLFLLGLFSRLPFLEKFQSHWDGPQYSIGIIKYSLAQSTPSLPGYPLYIGIGKLINFFVHDPHLSLLLLGAIFSGFGAAAIFFLGKILFNRGTGIIASLILLSAPSFYYFGITPYGYVVLPTMISLFAIGVYKSFIKHERYELYTAVIFGLYLAMRPQEIFYIFPLFLLTLWKKKSFLIFIQIGIISVITAAWFIPVASTIGGVGKYVFALLQTTSDQSLGGIRLLLNGSAYDVLVLRILRGIYLTLGLSGFYLILFALKHGAKLIKNRKNKGIAFLHNKLIIFYSLWILPAVFFNIVMRVEHAGYQFVYLVPFLVLSAFAVWRHLHKRIVMLVLVTVIIVLFNLITFFRDRDPAFLKPYSPTSFHYSEIKKNDLKMNEKFLYIKKHFSPKSTVIIIGTPELFLPVIYHYPEYLIYEFAALITDDGKFYDVRRMGKDMKYGEFKTTDRKLVLPDNISTIILFDDQAGEWLVGKHVQVSFPYNTHIVVIKRETGVFEYGKGKFRQI
jgi:hypothetical protein